MNSASAACATLRANRHAQTVAPDHSSAARRASTRPGPRHAMENKRQMRRAHMQDVWRGYEGAARACGRRCPGACGARLPAPGTRCAGGKALTDRMGEVKGTGRRHRRALGKEFHDARGLQHQTGVVMRSRGSAAHRARQAHSGLSDGRNNVVNNTCACSASRMLWVWQQKDAGAHLQSQFSPWECVCLCLASGWSSCVFGQQHVNRVSGIVRQVCHCVLAKPHGQVPLATGIEWQQQASLGVMRTHDRNTVTSLSTPHKP